MVAARSRSRRSTLDEDLRAVFMAAPWWVPPIVALAAGVGIRVGAERLGHVSPSTASLLGLIAALLILLIGLVALKDKAGRTSRLRGTRTLEHLRAMSWQEFEALLADAYRQYGWAVVELGARSRGADGGVDLVLRRGGEVVAVQCKRWTAWTIGVTAVRELQGALADFGAQRGIFVTSGRYTAEATAFAQRNRMQLLDGSGLLALLPASTRTAEESATSPHDTAVQMARSNGRP